MRIAIVGAGQVGTALGTGWQRAGHAVVYGAREPASSVPDAVAGADVVVLATPWPAAEELVRTLGDFGGKIVVDATNPIGPGFQLAVGHTTSGAEQLAARATGARVVKAFNTTGFENLAAPRYGARRLAMPIAGDDPAAVAAVAGLADQLGFEPIALPALARARELEPLALLWIHLARTGPLGRGMGFTIARRTATAAPPPPPPEPATPRAIAIVGTGHIGGALARAWLAAGHRVALAVRDTTAPDVTALVARGARAIAVAEAAAAADTIVLAVPAGAVPSLALGPLDGKVVVDCTNAIGPGLALQHGRTTSSAEELARRWPGARVVRSFNQQGAETLRDPVFGDLRATNFVAGDDAEARAAVADLARDVGLDAVDAGPLAVARYLEPMTVAWIAMASALGTRDFALSLVRRPG